MRRASEGSVRGPGEWGLGPLRVRRIERVQLHADLRILAGSPAPSHGRDLFRSRRKTAYTFRIEPVVRIHFGPNPPEWALEARVRHDVRLQAMTMLTFAPREDAKHERYERRQGLRRRRCRFASRNARPS
jgi:hypothetical protein